MNNAGSAFEAAVIQAKRDPWVFVLLAVFVVYVAAMIGPWLWLGATVVGQ